MQEKFSHGHQRKKMTWLSSLFWMKYRSTKTSIEKQMHTTSRHPHSPGLYDLHDLASETLTLTLMDILKMAQAWQKSANDSAK